MQVIKLGGSILTQDKIGNNVIELIRQVQKPAVFVVSALQGITDSIAKSFADRSIFTNPERVAKGLVLPYQKLAEKHISNARVQELFKRAVSRECDSFIKKARSHTHDTRAYCLSSGERLSAFLVSALIMDYSLARSDKAGKDAQTKIQGKAACLTDSSALALPCLFPEDIGSFAKQIFCNSTTIATGSSEKPGREDTAKHEPLNSGREHVQLVEACLNRPAVLRKALLKKLQSCPVIVFPGFYALDPHGSFILFGRGGSDYSAVAIACALNTGCTLCKDTGTFLSADPGLVVDAKPVQHVSYREAASLARGGAKIIHKGAILLAKKHRIPIRVADERGNINTIVHNTETAACSIKSISTRSIKNLAELSIVGEGITRESSLVIQALQSLLSQSIIPRSLSFDRLGHTIRISVTGEELGNALRILHRKLVEEKGLV